MKKKKDSPEDKLAQTLMLFGEQMMADHKKGDPTPTMHVALVDGKIIIADSKESFKASKDLVTETAKKKKADPDRPEVVDGYIDTFKIKKPNGRNTYIEEDDNIRSDS